MFARPWALLALLIADPIVCGAGTVVAVDRTRLAPPPIVQPVLDASREADGVRPRLQRLAAPDDRTVATLLPPNLPAFFGLEDMAAQYPDRAAAVDYC